MSSKANAAEAIHLFVLQVYAFDMESQYKVFLKEVEVALRKTTSSESFVLLGNFNAHMSIDSAGKVLLINMITIALTRTKDVYCSSVPHIFSAQKIHRYSWYRDSLGRGVARKKFHKLMKLSEFLA